MKTNSESTARSRQAILGTFVAAALPALALALLSSCGGASDPQASAEAPGIDARLADRFREAPPAAAAVPVQEVRGTVPDEGESVIVTGRIGGVLHPFSETHAVVTLIDDEVHTCERDPDDECPTPWDACCEDPAKLKAMRLTVQFTDEEGEPLPGSLKGVNDLAELDTVIVSGTVAAGASEENLVINATGIYREL